MATYVIKAFGITKEIVGGRETVVNTERATVGSLRETLRQRYPSLANIRSLMIAVNNSYAEDDLRIEETDEIALIPPVSGG